MTRRLLALLALSLAFGLGAGCPPVIPSPGGTGGAGTGGIAAWGGTAGAPVAGASGVGGAVACIGSGAACAACRNLRALGCPEGELQHCAEAMDQALSDLGIDYRPSCLAAATSKAAVRACGKGGVKCP